MDEPAVLWWVRRDLRLADNPALTAACATGQPVVPVFIHDQTVADLGAAARWRFGEGLAHFAERLQAMGSRLILRQGPAAEVLQDLIAQTGANAVFWNRAYDPAAVARDTRIKTDLKERGLSARSFAGHLIHEPWTTQTKTGGFYKVYSPFWRAVRPTPVPAPDPAPKALRPPTVWPASDVLSSWRMGAGMRRGAAVLAQHARVGEEAARTRLEDFCSGPIARYATDRNVVAVDGTSRLSEPLSYGEIGPRTCWHAGLMADEAGMAGAEHFCKELIWRDFAYHLMHHTPHILTDNWKPDWDRFPWQQDGPLAQAWRQGRTGIPFVDAGMREMYVTGTMHNRARMIVASYLTKHLMTHWKVGAAWFDDCLTDWDPASNAMGWQWAAGCGPDAAPYFRVFNPVSQREKFDPLQAYVKRWIAEGQRAAGAEALSYFDAIPRAWGLTAGDLYPAPIVTAEQGRARALAAYEAREF